MRRGQRSPIDCPKLMEWIKMSKEKNEELARYLVKEFPNKRVVIEGPSISIKFETNRSWATVIRRDSMVGLE